MEEVEHGVDEIVQSWSEVGRLARLVAPTRNTEAIALPLFYRSGIEHRSCIGVHLQSGYTLPQFSGRAEIQCVDILQNRSHTFAAKSLPDFPRQMIGRQVRFPKEDNDSCVRMPATNSLHRVRSVAIALCNTAHIAARRAIGS